MPAPTRLALDVRQLIRLGVGPRRDEMQVLHNGYPPGSWWVARHR